MDVYRRLLSTLGAAAVAAGRTRPGGSCRSPRPTGRLERRRHGLVLQPPRGSAAKQAGRRTSTGSRRPICALTVAEPVEVVTAPRSAAEPTLESIARERPAHVRTPDKAAVDSAAGSMIRPGRVGRG
jgi:hypothetical protein